MAATPPGITEHPFGSATLYTLTNRHGLQVEITNWGATLVAVRTPDRNGHMADILLGHDTLAGYEADTKTYFGALVGRYANRIANGRFRLDDRGYTLSINAPPNSLHGGMVGFNRKLWSAHPETLAGAPALELRLVSPSGDQGYPGRLEVRVVYSLTDDNALRIDFFATTDRDTVVNLTSHGYYNLGGRGSGDILGTELRILAHRYTPINAVMIPTGVIAPVAGTPLDFTDFTAIGARIHDGFAQLAIAGGYDFNYVLDGPGLAAEAYDPASGRELKLYTTQPGVQFYSGNSLPHAYAGFALEAEHFPDSPNHPNFPSTELKPGQTYHETTRYVFSTRAGRGTSP